MSGYQDVPMTRRRAQLLEEYASKLADMLEAAPDDKDLAEWVQSKIDRAAAAIQSAYHYLDQEDESELEKAVGHKYTHRKLIGHDSKTGRARYRYYYAEHQGGGISRAKFEAGSAFKLTWKSRRGHFHIDRVEGDQIFITHDSRPNMEPVPVQADELRALLTKQHSKAEQRHVEKRQREVEEIKRRAHRGGLGLALHRLRQAAAQAGVSLPEQYQRQPEKTRAPVAETARETTAQTTQTTPRDQLTSTAQQIIEDANQEHAERHDEHQEITRFELGEHTHTKTGAKLFTAKQTERVDRDEYFRRLEIAKQHGGRYERRYVRGFVFKNAEDARAFALEVEGAAPPETSAETVTPHDEHPGADNFETMPEVESVPTQRLRGVLDALSESERLNTINPKNRKRPKEAKGADAKLIKLVNELAEDQDPNERRFLRVMASMLQDVEKTRNAYERQESRKDRYATIREFIEKKLGVEPTITAPSLNEILSRPTTPSTRPASAYYGRATKKLVDQALSSEPTEISLNDARSVLPSKGDLREMLSQEQRLKRAKEDLASTGAPNFLGQKNPIQDIMYALNRYLNGPYVELGQGRIREMERGLKIALRDSKGEELEQVKDETARFWREWGGEYKRLQDEFARGRTQGEALRNIRPLIPDYVLTPEINQLLDQMERELDQRPVTGHDVARWIDTRDTNQATRDRQPKAQPTTPREQLTATAREVTQGADNFETMPEVESLANKKTARERSLALRAYKPEELIEIAAHAVIQDKAVNKEVDAKARELEREYKDLANTAARLGSEEELAKEGGNYRYQDAEQAAREKHEERLNLARIEIYNKVYRDILSHLRDQKTDYVERRSAIESRIKELNLSTGSFETAPATTPTSGTAQRQSVLDAAEEAQRLDAQGGSERSAAAIAADERLAETIRDLISNEYQGVEDVTRSDKPRRQWTVKERELNSLIDRLETLQSAKKRTRSMTAATAQNIRETTRGRLIDEMRSRIETDSRTKPTAPARQALTETAERVTSDQTAEQATTRATPRPSEATLRGSGELDEAVRANLQDRAQFLTSGSEDTTRTGMRSKAQKAKDGELLLIHRRLQSDAQERLGPTAPRFADYSQLVGMPRADQPENAETRAQFRTALKDAIRELEQATSGQVTKSARPLITYRAQLIQTVERLTAA